MVSESPLVWLHEKFSDKSWFHSVGQDEFGRLVVYVKTWSMEAEQEVPRQLAGKQVLVHFASSKEANRAQYTNDRRGPPPLPVVEMDIIDVTDEAELLEDESPPDLRSLTDELDRLEKTCGSNIMQDIFYEVHDGKNAVTNLSAKFPDVRQSLEKLYVKYGFDVIYEEMDG